MKQPIVQGLMNYEWCGRTFLKSYANQIPLDGGEKMFDEAPVIVCQFGQFIVMRKTIIIHYMTMMFPMIEMHVFSIIL